MKTVVKYLLAAFTILVAYLVVAPAAGAYQYPIFELGNCRDVKECHTYCEVPEHHPACWSYSVYGERVLADETPETQVAQLGIVFPVVELGNCANLKECKNYCILPQNLTACQQYAQLKGLSKKERIVEKAKTELGCTTASECQAFCSEGTNKDTCEAFAKRYHLRSEIKDRLIEKGKTELGCANKEECKALCEQPENRIKCQLLSRKLRADDTTRREQLVEKAKTELGCTTFESCKTFCQDKTHWDKCRNFGTAVRNDAASKTKERLGCTTNEECRKECEAHPDKCPTFPKRPQPLPSGVQPGPLNRSENSGPRYINRGSNTFVNPSLEQKVWLPQPETPEPVETKTHEFENETY